MPLGEVADTLDREAAAVRQLAVRARRNVEAARPRFPVKREEGERIGRTFFAASTSGDTAALRTLGEPCPSRERGCRGSSSDCERAQNV
ncbi:RNA polymerase sigma-70 factor ECF subfamily [Methylorubrum populi]|uniref:RNA polymerase sigma-70 factor ECF subfamily n=1 Tax=Methylorubrum populi TaxID=223967 RepID=A0A833N1P9_9HYPH|nr:RNA polymerase sigma-70 factor ECF subfamily [Methylorubrum populi]